MSARFAPSTELAEALYYKDTNFLEVHSHMEHDSKNQDVHEDNFISVEPDSPIKFSKNVTLWQVRIFVLTFLSYGVYTATRVPYSTTKASLPFDAEKVGLLDSSFLAFYSVGLFVIGPLGDRVDLRFFLGIGMISSGFWVILFGGIPYFGLNELPLYLLLNAFAGLSQSTGWPGNVSLLSRWFPHYRGTIMGIWNAHASIGNIVGKFVTTACLAYSWQLAFIVSGATCIATGCILLILVESNPSNVLPYNDAEKLTLRSSTNYEEFSSISFLRALRVPGVVTFSICLFFVKFVAYSFMLWLPFYLVQIGYAIDVANRISIIYDLGGVIGGVIAGIASDRTGRNGTVCATMLILCVPILYLYIYAAQYSLVTNAIVMFAVGVVCGGPYTLISSAVSAELGSHISLQGNPKAISTVTSVIDGTGSAGSVLTGLVLGHIGHAFGWNSIIWISIAMSVASAFCLIRIVRKELYSANMYTNVNVNDNTARLGTV